MTIQRTGLPISAGGTEVLLSVVLKCNDYSMIWSSTFGGNDVTGAGTQVVRQHAYYAYS